VGDLDTSLVYGPLVELPGIETPWAQFNKTAFDWLTHHVRRSSVRSIVLRSSHSDTSDQRYRTRLPRLMNFGPVPL
jgi:hypothetical protein